MNGILALIILASLIFGLILIIIIELIIKGLRNLKEAREIAKARKCPYIIEEEALRYGGKLQEDNDIDSSRIR